MMNVSYWAFSIAIAFAVAPITAFSDEAGHGPEISGVGPKGGAMTSVVRAIDAEKHRAAPAVAIAEWVRAKDGILVHFRKLEDRSALPCPVEKQEMKVILTGRALSKPMVFTQSFGGIGCTQVATTLVPFTKAEGAQVGLVEVILPSGIGTITEKLVSAYRL